EPHAIIAYDDEWIYFAARTQRFGVEIWRSNGELTQMLRDSWPGPFGSTPNDFMALDEQVCYSAADKDHGRELWCIVHDTAEAIMTRPRN
ncbi:MAG: hypothetical protein O2899_05340, partial [Bacteroidetes bacterium]|nr:hypothetical protein [Bacteroidota bacterium]